MNVCAHTWVRMGSLCTQELPCWEAVGWVGAEEGRNFPSRPFTAPCSTEETEAPWNRHNQGPRKAHISGLYQEAKAGRELLPVKPTLGAGRARPEPCQPGCCIKKASLDAWAWLLADQHHAPGLHLLCCRNSNSRSSAQKRKSLRGFSWAPHKHTPHNLHTHTHHRHPCSTYIAHHTYIAHTTVHTTHMTHHKMHGPDMTHVHMFTPHTDDTAYMPVTCTIIHMCYTTHMIAPNTYSCKRNIIQCIHSTYAHIVHR